MTEKNNTNNHAREYLKTFFDDQSPPLTAILISGEWGCGKTWFIQDVIEEYIKKIKKGKNKDDSKKLDGLFLYISVYGMKNISDIENEIYTKLSPISSSKAFSITASIGNSFSKKFFIDLNDLKEVLKMFSKIKDKILIFDDLERSFIPSKELFGYINKFVEHNGQKVVLIANEEQLFQNDDDTKNVTFNKKHKEKIIGATFKINSDFDNTYTSFRKLFKNDTKASSIYKGYKGYKGIIKQTYDEHGNNNLRNLRQAMRSFAYFKEQFEPTAIGELEKINSSLRHKGSNNRFSDFIGAYFLIFFLDKSGNLSKDKWEEFLKHTRDPKKLSAGTKKLYEVLYTVHSYTPVRGSLLKEKLYDAVVNNIDVRRELKMALAELKETVARFGYQNLLNLSPKNLINLSREELKKNHEELWDCVRKSKLYNVYDLLEAYGILLFLQPYSIIPASKDEIKKAIENCFTKSKQDLGDDYLSKQPSFFSDLKKDPNHYNPARYYSDIIEEHKELIPALNEYIATMISFFERKWDEKVTEKATEEAKSLNITSKDFYMKIEIYGRYLNIPILHYIPEEQREEKFESVIKLQHSEYTTFFINLKKRYTSPNLKLLPEKEFFLAFEKYLNTKLAPAKKGPYHNVIIIKYHILQYNINNLLENLEAAEKLEAEKKQK